MPFFALEWDAALSRVVGGRATSVDVELGLAALAAMLSPRTLTFSVLALVLSDRPLRMGLWFFIGAFGLTLMIGVVVAFVLGAPRDPKRTADAIKKMSKISSSPVIAIVAAGARLANPGGFIPIALTDTSQLKPSTAGSHRPAGWVRPDPRAG